MVSVSACSKCSGSTAISQYEWTVTDKLIVLSRRQSHGKNTRRTWRGRPSAVSSDSHKAAAELPRSKARALECASSACALSQNRGNSPGSAGGTQALPVQPWQAGRYGLRFDKRNQGAREYWDWGGAGERSDCDQPSDPGQGATRPNGAAFKLVEFIGHLPVQTKEGALHG